MLKFFKKVLGTKHDRDVKGYMPVVEKVNEEFAKLENISNDELRNKTLEFKARIAEHLKDIDDDIAKLRADAEVEKDIFVKEDLYKQIDDLGLERDKALEVVLKDLLPEAFAVVKETARRFMLNDELVVTATDYDRNMAAGGNSEAMFVSMDTHQKTYIKIDGDKARWQSRWIAGGNEIRWDMMHYDVQLIGGMVLHDGKIAEMATGEGKTLVATLPAYLNGLSGLGCHIITVNDYLAKRDSEWVGPIFEFLFLTVDCIDRYKPHSDGRKKAYKCDVTYGTNNEFGFDYLRDNMVSTMDDMVQRKLHYCVVDEVDSVLIDDARTPLIISGPASIGQEEQEYVALKPNVERLLAEQRKLATSYLAQGKKLFKEGKLGVEEGQAGMSLLRAYKALPKYRPLIKFMSEEGVKVEVQKTENHYMQENSKRMYLVDDELFFTIDEKNRSTDLTEKGAEFLARGNDDPELFLLPDISMMMLDIDADESLTEEEKREKKNEAVQEYSIKTKRLHTVNQLLKAYTLFEKEEEYVVINGEVKIVDESTGRMMEGRRYSDGLHQALEAKENVKVGDITQTYATVTLQNYFRMYHKLAGMTGTAETEAGEFWEIYKLDVVVIPTNRPIVRDDREDLVYKTDKEKFNAVIETIVELTNNKRPVLVGTTTVDISEKLSRMLNMRGVKHNVLNAKLHQREADIVADAGKPGAVTIATNMAGRGTDIKISDEVKAAGGLAIIGTERHDSRRVDRQLRGRAGRQGDPGSSQFFISLEDKLMRLFNSDRIAKLMDKMGHTEGEVIQHSMVSKSIERAQKRVEENNFGTRKRLIDYDDVMNIQREAIYTKRRNALSGERLSVDIYNMFMGLTEVMVTDHRQGGDYASFKEASFQMLGIDPEMEDDFFVGANLDEVIKAYQDKVFDFYRYKQELIKEILLPIIKDVYEKEGNRYKRISVPYTDGGANPLPVSADLEESVKSNGENIMRDIEKTISLGLIDDTWKEHLRSMDELKESSQSASFEQKDPLVIYKMEAYNLFENLIYNINEKVTSYLIKGKVIFSDGTSLEQAKQRKDAYSKMSESRSAGSTATSQMSQAAAKSGQQQKPQTIRREEPKVGRNDLCPCGSGKKYKHCHGK